MDNKDPTTSRQKTAMMTAIAVMMYILSVLPLVILNELGYRHAEVIGLAFLFIMAAAATGLIIYATMTKLDSGKLSSKDENDDDGKDSIPGESREQKQMRGAISTALWTVITVLYFIISFATFAWHVTWIIFLIGGAIEAIINLLFTAKKSGGQNGE